jgi:hypothetical protein
MIAKRRAAQALGCWMVGLSVVQAQIQAPTAETAQQQQGWHELLFCVRHQASIGHNEQQQYLGAYEVISLQQNV